MIKKLTVEEFNTFQKNHKLSNIYQTINYAMLMSENGYDYELIGYEEENILKVASLILIKKINGKLFYGYSPRGFLMDYLSPSIIEKFTKELIEYYRHKNFAFIKINPNLKICNINNNFEIEKNDNYDAISYLEDNGYKRLKNNLYFEAQLPRFNALIDLKKFNINQVTKNTRNKIRKGLRKGLQFEKVEKDKIYNFYEFIKNKKTRDSFYYQDYYTVFDKDNKIDLFLISINYNEYLENSEYSYNLELNKNNKLNDLLTEKSLNFTQKNIKNEKIINKKMQSDKSLLSYKNDVVDAINGIQYNKNEKIYIAGALVIRHKNIAYIVMSGYNNNFKKFVPNYFLHYKLIEYYKENFDFLDLNGVVGDFKNQNPYRGLNRFKLGFNPNIYENIGEFDLIINNKTYKSLLKNGILAKEFNRTDIKTSSIN